MIPVRLPKLKQSAPQKTCMLLQSATKLHRRLLVKQRPPADVFLSEVDCLSATVSYSNNTADNGAAVNYDETTNLDADIFASPAATVEQDEDEELCAEIVGICSRETSTDSINIFTVLSNGNMVAARNDMCDLTKTTAISSSSSSQECDDIQNAIIDLAASVPENRFDTLQNFFQFEPILARFDLSSLRKEGSLQWLAATTGLEYSSVCKQVGEPRALQVYSNISAILQKQPPDVVFQPGKTYVVALLYLGWELAGSWGADSNGPSILRSVPHKEVLAGVCVLMNHMGRRS